MLTIREQGSAASGTLSRPLELPVDLSRVDPAPVLRRLTLGYGGTPATAVYGFTASRRVSVTVSRRSPDRLAVHVDLALLEATSRRRVAALLAGSSGAGQEVIVPAGRYLIVAALLVPETIELELEARITPVKTPLRGAGGGSGSGSGRRAAGGRAIGSGSSPSQALCRRPLAAGSGSGSSQALLTPTLISAISGRLVAAATGAGGGSGALGEFQWVDIRGRAMGPDITIRPARWDRSPHGSAEDLLLLRLTDQAGAPLDLSGVEVVLEAWDQARLWRYALYETTIVDAPGGVVRLELDGGVSARPSDGSSGAPQGGIALEDDQWLVSEADLYLTLEDGLLHTLPDEICWDLRVRSLATGATVYLLEGRLSPQPRYTVIAQVALDEAGGLLLTEDQQLLAMESV